MHLIGRDADPTSPHIDRQRLGKAGLPILPPLEGLSILPPFPPTPCEEQPNRCVRGVAFDESANKIIEFERVTAQEFDQVWYSREHMDYFRWERKQLAFAIQQAQAHEEEENSSNDDEEDKENNSNNNKFYRNTCRTWSQALLHVYCVFRQYDNAADVSRALRASPPMEMDEYTIGLEKCLLRPLARDFNVRRQHLVTQMAYLQTCDYATPAARENMLRDTSRLASRAARLFAQYTAQIAYETKC